MELLGGERLVGVVHLGALPGAPRFDRDGGMERVLDAAVRDASAFVDGGASVLVVENFGDVPFRKGRVEAETVAAMARCVDRVRSVAGVRHVGVNVLRNDVRSALGIAASCGASFVRVNVHTGVMFTDQGMVEGTAADTIRWRDAHCPDVRVLCDVHVKHATPIAGETLEDAARDTWLRGCADALIVSGVATGAAPDGERVARVRRAVGGEAPILIGSGFGVGNAGELLAHADAAIVGTAAKENGDVRLPVDAARVRQLVGVAEAARS